MEHTIYLVFAVAGCTLVAVQVALQVMGFMGDADIDDVHADADLGHFDADGAHFDVDGGDAGDHDAGHGVEGHGNLFFGILSFKALCAFAGIFGLTGLILEGSDLSVGLRVVFAAAAGFAAMLAVARLMMALGRLHSSGSLDIRNAVGHTGTVYTRIPGANSGWGKVTVDVQGRSLELRAVTDGEELTSGTRVSVVSVAGDETLKVERI